MYWNMLGLFFMIMNVIIMLVSVAFLTLFERKLLSYIQFRKGPNKVGLIGLFQPFSDAIKLFLKELLFLKKVNLIMFFMGPMFGFFLSMFFWMLLMYGNYNNIQIEFFMLLLINMMMISVYSVMISGWSSNSNYSMLGAMRSVCQSISYEIVFSIILIILMMMVESLQIMDFLKYQFYMKFILMMLPLFFLFYISLLAELNRSPFDLMEGESELVSGFNTEYSSSLFALIFLSEYSLMIFYNYIILILFLGLNYKFLFIFLMMMNSLIIIIRGIMPRIRYDQLMYFCWLSMLPFILVYMFIMLFLKLIFYISLNSLYY